MVGVGTGRECEACGGQLFDVDREVGSPETTNLHLRYFRCGECGRISMSDEQILDNLANVLYRVGFTGQDLLRNDLEESLEARRDSEEAKKKL